MAERAGSGSRVTTFPGRWAVVSLPSVGQIRRFPLLGQKDAASSVVDALDSIGLSVRVEATHLQSIDGSTELTHEAVAGAID